MAKIIAIFNHKGGVSKTTTSFNIGWALASRGKRVLLVDADSQCNLSLYIMGSKKFDEFYAQDNKQNIKDALEPAFKSKPRLIMPVDCFQATKNKNLFLLPGHLDLSECEVQLGLSFQLTSSIGALENLPGSFYYLFTKTAEKYYADYIIVDMNPSLSSINQDLIISSDFFLVPTSPDVFSYLSIKSLSRILPSWENWAKRARLVFKDSEYPLPKNTPKFIGYTINDFNLSQGKPTKAFAEQMNRISLVVTRDLVPNLNECGMMLPSYKYEEAKQIHLNNQRVPDDYNLAEISNFNKLIAISNKLSIPVFAINENSLMESQKRTLAWFKSLFSVIARKIELLTQ